MFGDKINKNLWAIVYRYKWQSKINKVNKEYHEFFESLRQNDIDKNFHYYSLKRSNVLLKLKQPCEFNDGSRGEFFLNRRPSSQKITSYVYNFNLLKNRFGIDPNCRIPDNYIYTSTKYLREIKERGIKCLIDNV